MHTMEYAAKSARSCILCQTLIKSTIKRFSVCECVFVPQLRRGKGKGFKDPAAKPLFAGIRTVQGTRPKIFVLECVEAMAARSTSNAAGSGTLQSQTDEDDMQATQGFDVLFTWVQKERPSQTFCQSGPMDWRFCNNTDFCRPLRTLSSRRLVNGITSCFCETAIQSDWDFPFFDPVSTCLVC